MYLEIQLRCTVIEVPRLFCVHTTEVRRALGPLGTGIIDTMGFSITSVVKLHRRIK